MFKRKYKYYPIPNYSNEIILIQQFHIPKQSIRYKEICDTLKKNVANPKIKIIYLLNEKYYTPKELGFHDGVLPSKIHQIEIVNRLTYYIVFKFVRTFIRNQWVIFSNNDIYYDSTIQNLISIIKRKSRNTPRNFICLQRYEIYPSIRLDKDALIKGYC